jgi:peptide/nickel transport system substrate-binding protein
MTALYEEEDILMSKRNPQVQQWLEAMRDNQLSRRQLLKRGAALGLAVPTVSALLAACDPDDDGVDDEAGGVEPMPDDDDTDDDADVEPDDEVEEDDDVDEEPADTDDDTDDEDDDAAAEGDGQEGGTLEVALIGEPPTLDIHQTTATIVALIAWHIYEPLFTWDEDYQVTPELAEDLEVSDDGLTNTLRIREGVTFHNGDDLTADDVIASIERWAGISGLGESLMNNVEEVEIVDDHTIDFHMVEPYGAFAVALARQNQGCGIYPASIVEESGDDGLSEHIGTGPYQLEAREADQYVHLVRFEDYVTREEETSGYAGQKNQYIDEIYMRPVPDEAGRIAGLQAGDFHYLESIIPDHFESLEGDENVTVEIMGTSGWAVFVMNTAEGIFTDQTLRKAVQAAVDCEPVMQAGYGDGFFELDPGIMTTDTVWNSQVGEEFYNMADPDRAGELLEEAGYDGTPVRIMTTQEYQHQYNQAVMLEQQLADAGFEVDLEVFDWATLTERRNDQTAWDIFTTSFSFRVDPIQLPMLQGTSWPGWWDSEEKVELTDRLERETEFEDRYEVLEQIQELFYEEAPQVKIGDSLELSARSPLVQNFTTPTQLQPAFWNIWLDEE